MPEPPEFPPPPGPDTLPPPDTIPPPTPGPEPEPCFLPSIKIDNVSFWDNGPFGRAPSWLQVYVEATVEHLDSSDYLNHYVTIQYQIHDRWYIFYPNPKLPPNPDPWTEAWFTSVELQSVEDGDTVVGNEIFRVGIPTYPSISDFIDYGQIRVQAILWGGNGDDFGIEVLTLLAMDEEIVNLEHTMFGAPK